MNSVHSKEMAVTITGNMITHHGVKLRNLNFFIAGREQVSLILTEDNKSDSLYDVSSPMSEADRREYAGLIHRLNSQNKLGQNRNPDDPGPKGPTPPTGGTPGAARKTFYDHIKAIAA